MSVLRVFGYGSLMFEPPMESALLGTRPASVPDLVRAFNKKSRNRGCKEEDAFLPDSLTGWTSGGRRLSLALGTKIEPGAVLTGRVLSWPAERAEAILAELDEREGYRPDRPPEKNGYQRVEVDVGGELAWMYQSNPGSLHHVALGLAPTADVLARATPKEPGDVALGADYLLRTLKALERAEVVDRELGTLARISLRLLRGSGRVLG